MTVRPNKAGGPWVLRQMVPMVKAIDSINCDHVWRIVEVLIYTNADSDSEEVFN